MTRREIDIDEFIIEYDYFGLSSSAEIKKRMWKAEPYYKCFLHSSAQQINIRQVTEKEMTFWIDMSVGSTTPLSQILGQAIENTLDSHIC